MQEEYYFQCPYCGEQISMLLDLTISEQMYVEDCEVCCQPMQIHYGVVNDAVDWFEAQRLE